MTILHDSYNPSNIGKKRLIMSTTLQKIYDQYRDYGYKEIIVYDMTCDDNNRTVVGGNKTQKKKK